MRLVAQSSKTVMCATHYWRWRVKLLLNKQLQRMQVTRQTKPKRRWWQAEWGELEATLLNHRHSKERCRLYYPEEDSLTDWLTDISISHLRSFTFCFWSKGRFFILEKFLRETTYFQYNLLRSRDGSYRREGGGWNLAVFYERHFAGRESERHKCGAMRLRWSLLAVRKSPLLDSWCDGYFVEK